MVRFLSLSSGSCGNCYYLGTEAYGILIDAGIPVREVQKTMREYGLPFDRLMGVFITHDHTDHIRAAGSLGEIYHLPVYATEQVHRGMYRNYGMSKKLSEINKRYIERDVAMTPPGTQFRITPFSVPHDSTDNVGYSIELGDEPRAMRFCLVTDCGVATPDIASHLSRADHIVIESNHDIDMLLHGRYPDRLKHRVMGEGGHLSNRACADLLHAVWHRGIRHVLLCHLSGDNNTPQLALDTTAAELAAMGVKVGDDVTLQVLQRGKPTGPFVLQGDEPRQLEIPFE